MTLMSRSIAGLSVLVLIAPALTHAAGISVGQREYENKCAREGKWNAESGTFPGSLRNRQAAKGPRRVSHRRKALWVALAVRSHALKAVRRSWSFETSWQRCRLCLGGDRSVRGTGARRRVGTENAQPDDESLAEAGDCGVNRIVHRPAPGETLESGINQ
jgi:hypothetical protein